MYIFWKKINFWYSNSNQFLTTDRSIRNSEKKLTKRDVDIFEQVQNDGEKNIQRNILHKKWEKSWGAVFKWAKKYYKVVKPMEKYNSGHNGRIFSEFLSCDMLKQQRWITTAQKYWIKSRLTVYLIFSADYQWIVRVFLLL